MLDFEGKVLRNRIPGGEGTLNQTNLEQVVRMLVIQGASV